MSSAPAASPMTDASWSMTPQGTPAKSCSACRQRRAFSCGSSVAPAAFSSSVAVATSRAALLDKPPPKRKVRDDRRVHRPDDQTAIGECAHDAAQVVGPGWLARRLRSVEANVDRSVERRAVDPQAAAVAVAGDRRGGNHDMPIDRQRQHVAAVVVGVLANQIDPPWRHGQPARRGAEPLDENAAGCPDGDAVRGFSRRRRPRRRDVIRKRAHPGYHTFRGSLAAR